MQVLQSLWQVIEAAGLLAVALLSAIAPWTPLLAWIAFWLFAVNWKKLYPVLMQGAWIGVLLLGLMAVLVWSSIAVPESGRHQLFGLEVSNIVGKTVYVTSLAVIAFLCGSVQLSGACGSLCRFEEPVPVPVDDHSHH